MIKLKRKEKKTKVSPEIKLDDKLCNFG